MLVMRTWPELDAAIFEPRLRDALGGRELPEERIDELALVVACALGNASALTELDALLRSACARAVKPVDPGAVDEITQQVRERLLIPDAAGRTRLSEFRAEAPLGAWLRAVAMRSALNARRGQNRERHDSAAMELPAPDADPELALLRARHRESFREAFASAVAGLTARERTVLRLHTLDGLTLARIGAMYQKDTSTVSRWLEQIRKTLNLATRNQLAGRLQLSPSELESVMRAADSELSVSLPRLLQTQS